MSVFLNLMILFGLMIVATTWLTGLLIIPLEIDRRFERCWGLLAMLGYIFITIIIISIIATVLGY